jgi:small-conductance mechanosensitive channel
MVSPIFLQVPPDTIPGWWADLAAEGLLRPAAILLIGLPLIYLAGWFFGRVARDRGGEHLGTVVRKLLLYVGWLGLLGTLLSELGFDLTALMATAGIATVAIGFAAQTSLSNLISGLFLVAEKPFAIGDLIRVGQTLGVVHSIDLLSVKLRTLDNLFVRLPNETMIKSEVTNITRFPIRRMDFNVGVAYKEDIRRVLAVLKDIIEKNPHCLIEPEPLLFFDNFGESALLVRVGVWFEKSKYLACRNSLLTDIKERFDAEKIEIPFPHITVYTGSQTQPFPVATEPLRPTGNASAHKAAQE